jgi:catechol 2,3-dioxygenase
MCSYPPAAVLPAGLPRLGHAVIKVRDLERALAFYRDALGLREVARHGGDMVFLSSGETHHELALVQVEPGDQAVPPNRRQVGLHHLAFRVGEHLDTLRAWRDRLRVLGIPILGLSDHRVSQSIYLRDPDGLLIELYVDADPAIWRADPAAVAHVAPLSL